MLRRWQESRDAGKADAKTDNPARNQFPSSALVESWRCGVRIVVDGEQQTKLVDCTIKKKCSWSVYFRMMMDAMQRIKCVVNGVLKFIVAARVGNIWDGGTS